MSEKIFNEPRIALNRIYTRAGDAGETRLVGGQRVPKDDARIDCFGVVDELNAFLGLARTTVEELSPQAPALAPFAATLKRVKHELFNLGSILATLPADVHPKRSGSSAKSIRPTNRLPLCALSCCRAAAASTPSCMFAGRSAAGQSACWSRSPDRKARLRKR